MSNEKMLDALYAKHAYEYNYDESFILLSELEKKVICIFFCTYSQIFRSDYLCSISFKKYICSILDHVICKMPYYQGKVLCRYCNNFDRDNLAIGDIYIPNHSLTTSSVLENMMPYDKWTHKYIINVASKTKAHNLYLLWKPEYKALRNEYQVNFETNSQYIVTDIRILNGRKYIYMDELEI